jgi:hypothetical protein
VSGDILALALSLGARLRRCGAEHAGPCPRCGGTDRFSINVHKQVFNCRGCGVGGDAIDLARHLRGVSFTDAKALVEGERAKRAELVQRRPFTLVSTSGSNDPAVSVARILKGLVPVLGTIGERYLRETRGIDVAAIEDMLAEPYAIGWHPGVYFNQPGHPLHGQRLGCIVAILTDPVTGKPTGAISRTYIGPDLQKVGKAKSLGQGGGIVRLSADEDLLEGLHVGEGIETCLDAAAHPVLAARPIWSCGSAATLAKLPVLAGVEALSVVADHDPDGAGERAARELEARWLDAGREVVIYRPATFGDLNDTLKGA